MYACYSCDRGTSVAFQYAHVDCWRQLAHRYHSRVLSHTPAHHKCRTKLIVSLSRVKDWVLFSLDHYITWAATKSQKLKFVQFLWNVYLWSFSCACFRYLCITLFYAHAYLHNQRFAPKFAPEQRAWIIEGNADRNWTTLNRIPIVAHHIGAVVSK